VADVTVVLCCILFKWIAAVFPVKKKKRKNPFCLKPAGEKVDGRRVWA